MAMKVLGIRFAIILSFLVVLITVIYAYQLTLQRLSYRPTTPPPNLTDKVTVSPTGSATSKSALPALVAGEKSLKIPILTYHYISYNGNQADTIRTSLSTLPATFEEQLKLLQTHGFTTVSLDELAAAFTGNYTLPAKAVILTFDDGYRDFYTNAVPLLTKYQMKGVVFIATGLVGGGNYLTWNQIEELSRSPLVSFAAHTVHHYALTGVGEAVLKSELEESKLILEQHVSYRINWMAYPYGNFDQRVMKATQRAGYIGSATMLPDSWQYQSRFFYLPRIRVGNQRGNDFLQLVK